MNKITSILIKPFEASIYVKPLTLEYKQDGIQKSYELITMHDSVAILIYNITRNVLVFVKQFRPSVYLNSIPQNHRKEIDINKYPAKLGITIELCAGIVDKTKPLNEIAAEEILEECGYQIAPNKLEKVGSYCGGAVVKGGTQTLYYCEVTDEMKMSTGGGVGNEIIEIIEMSVPEVKEYISNQHHNRILSPSSFLCSFYWFLYLKHRKK